MAIFKTLVNLFSGNYFRYGLFCPNISIHKYLPVDFTGPHCSVCSCGVSSGSHGAVRFFQVVFHQEVLAVCNIWHWSLYQFYDHHVTQCCKSSVLLKEGLI